MYYDNKKGKYKKENKKIFKENKESIMNNLRKARDKEIKEVKININETIVENNKKNKKGLYCRSLCTTIFDVNNLFPLALEETNNYANENNHIVEILNKINMNDNSTIIFDRKYYSIDLLKFLKNKNITPIFRLDISNNFVRKINEEDKNEIIEKVKDIDIKILKYTIENEFYYIATTNLNLTVNEIKEIYWKRWKVEEFYKTLKHKMKGWFYNKSNKINYLGALKAQQFGYLFSRLMLIISEKFNISLKEKKKKETKNKYIRKINFTEAMNISVEHILYNTICSDTINDNLFIFIGKNK